MRAVGVVLSSVALGFAVLLFPSSAWALTELPIPTPSASLTSEPSPVPTVTETVTETAEPSAAPGEDTGVYVDPASGALRVDENTGVAVGVGAWLLAVTAGLLTARAVMP